jgi:hypothetical protein
MTSSAASSFPSKEKQNRASKPVSQVVPTIQYKENVRTGHESESPQLISAIDHTEEDEIEETIITAGARSASFVQAEVVEADDDDFPNSPEATDFTKSNQDEPKAKTSRKPAPGFVLSEELPRWFPKNIKDIYAVNRNGGSLSFKVCFQAYP